MGFLSWLGSLGNEMTHHVDDPEYIAARKRSNPSMNGRELRHYLAAKGVYLEIDDAALDVMDSDEAAAVLYAWAQRRAVED